jgi:LysM domain
MSVSSRRRSLAAVAAAGTLVALVLAACVPQPVARGTPGSGGTSPAPTAPPASATPAGPTPSLTFSRPTATPQPTFFSYRVRTGDTVTSIAREFETTARSIGYWNREAYPSLDPDSSRYNPNNIRVGWTLLLIPGVEVDPDEITPPPTAAPASPEAGG